MSETVSAEERANRIMEASCEPFAGMGQDCIEASIREIHEAERAAVETVGCTGAVMDEETGDHANTCNCRTCESWRRHPIEVKQKDINDAVEKWDSMILANAAATLNTIDNRGDRAVSEVIVDWVRAAKAEGFKLGQELMRKDANKADYQTNILSLPIKELEGTTEMNRTVRLCPHNIPVIYHCRDCALPIKELDE